MKTTGSRKVDMIGGDVKKILIQLTLPMMMGFIAMIIFNTADTIYVGMLGSDELAALSFTFPVAMFFIGLAQGLGIGASSVVAREMGAGNLERSRHVTTHIIILAFGLGLFFSVVGYFSMDPLFRLLGANRQTLPLVREYMKIWYLGISFIMVPIVGNNIIRATGDAKTPMYIMLVAVVFNIVFDPLLIFGLGPFPELELAGAAIATVVARSGTMLVTMYVLTHREKLFVFERFSFAQMLRSWRDVLHVGAPAAATQLMAPVSMGILTFLAAQHGNNAVAAIGVGSRVDFIAVLPVFGLGATMLPFAGQNLGAGRPERVREALDISIRFTAFWGLVVAVSCSLLAPYIGMAFTQDGAILDKTTLYFLVIPWAYGFFGLVFLVSGYFNAAGKPMPAMVLNFARHLAFSIPLAAAGHYLFGFVGILGGVTLGIAGAGVWGLVWVKQDVARCLKDEGTCSEFDG